MRAAWYERTGDASDVLEVGEMETPSPAAGEVPVRVMASGINQSDTKRRAGWRGHTMAFPRIVPHSDGAGIVEAVGAGVDRARIGQRVWLYNAQRDRPWGTAAQYVALPADQAVPLPDGVDFATGACLGVPASTAHFAVFSDGPVAGLTVLVASGSGGVGHNAVQFATAAGATVIATTGSDARVAYVLGAGADHVINYLTETVADRVLEITGGAGVDRVVEVDFGANLATDVAVIKPNGVIASYSSTRVPEPVLPYYPLAYKGVTVRFVQAYLLPAAARAAAIRDINAALVEGTLVPSVGAVYPLERIGEAHRMAEILGRVQGRVVIDLAAGKPRSKGQID